MHNSSNILECALQIPWNRAVKQPKKPRRAWDLIPWLLWTWTRVNWALKDLLLLLLREQHCLCNAQPSSVLQVLCRDIRAALNYSAGCPASGINLDFNPALAARLCHLCSRWLIFCAIWELLRMKKQACCVFAVICVGDLALGIPCVLEMCRKY